METTAAGNVLRILTPDRKAGLSISITSAGICLRVTGERLEIEAEGALHLRADELSLHGKSGVSITSDGDAAVRVGGDIVTEARAQTIRARLGNVDVVASDDVKLNGERIRLNT